MSDSPGVVNREPLPFNEESQRIKLNNLRKKIELLSKKSNVDKKMIKCLQNKQRRLLAKQGKLSARAGSPVSGDESDNSVSEGECVSSETQMSQIADGSIAQIDFREDIEEPMDMKMEFDTMEEDLANDSVQAGPSTGNIGDGGLNEDMIYYTEVKTEITDDPLMDDMSATIQAPLAVSMKVCEEGFVPARTHSLPRVGSLAVAEYIAVARQHHNRAALLAVTNQPIEDLNSSIGFVQLKREGDDCTVKCVVVDEEERPCELSCREGEDTLLDGHCGCRREGCLHLLTALLWLRAHADSDEDVSYWCEPTAGLPRAATLAKMFGASPPRPADTGVLEKFLRICQESQNFNPAIMRYYCEDERTKCSLHKLACKFAVGRNRADNAAFLTFCRSQITAEDCKTVERVTMNNFEVKREILYGRIDETAAYEISKATPGDFDAIVDAIMYPDDEEPVSEDIPSVVIEVLEKTMNTKITKCGTLIDRKVPMFAVTPYGTTPTHVVQIKKLDDSTLVNQNRKLTMLESMSSQLQMYFANKEFGYMCIFQDRNVDVKVVKINRQFCAKTLEKCAEFWMEHVLDRIIMKDN